MEAPSPLAGYLPSGEDLDFGRSGVPAGRLDDLEPEATARERHRRCVRLQAVASHEGPVALATVNYYSEGPGDRRTIGHGPGDEGNASYLARSPEVDRD